ncbi:LysM peptidoglycan-binding domain-containing protein [Fundicoccus culcitae]|uniref:LysM peptidoglycan-binding domain-containing protein n=1 Tax=Fundicoccus culcitae TaxID=2969821 RepID=A0ABY5P5C9_9LACT|nr:LysM peptidoglycan-binding domain-containing protein [Fundicoccus culcitae]UUX33680.1 LysM peptidoglycan-binding domain-containing protein [Fundicoccus culcitae]
MSSIRKQGIMKRLTKFAITASTVLLLSPGAISVGAQSQTHTVKAGEYLYLIANMYDVSVSQLKSWNNLTSDLILVGAVLNVSGPTQSTSYTVKYGDTLWGIANRFGVTVAQLKTWNGLSSDFIRTGMQLKLTAPTPTPTPSGTYTVKSGDTLWKIANQYGLTISQLRSWNGISGDLIRVGQVLRLTAPTTTPDPGSATSHTVVSGDTLYKIAERYGVTVAQLRSWNGISGDLIRVGQVLRLTAPTTTPDPGSATSHTVVSGDTLYKIAERYGVTVAQLRSWNGISGDLIRVGQVLRLTAPTTTPDPGSTTVHQVVAGDTLYTIAQRYGVTVAQLKEWNSLVSDLLQIGKRLHVVEPDYSQNPVKTYVVKAGDTLYKIAKEQGVSVNELRLWNHLTTDLIQVGQELKIAIY